MTAARPLRLAPVLTPVLALLAGLFVVLGPAPSASAADKDCSDFATQKAAQIFFLKNGGPSRDPHRLDAEGDGIACESNPCACYYKNSAGRSPRSWTATPSTSGSPPAG
jgi:hypothetical protein